MDRKFVVTSLVYLLAGLAMGIVMAATQDHGQLVTHAHIMLVGFLLSFIYGLLHKLWLNNYQSILASIQFYAHQLGALGMSIGLFLLYGHIVDEAKVGPVLGMFSALVLLGAVLMSVVFVKSARSS